MTLFSVFGFAVRFEYRVVDEMVGQRYENAHVSLQRIMQPETYQLGFGRWHWICSKDESEGAEGTLRTPFDWVHAQLARAWQRQRHF